MYCDRGEGLTELDRIPRSRAKMAWADRLTGIHRYSSTTALTGLSFSIAMAAALALAPGAALAAGGNASAGAGGADSPTATGGNGADGAALSAQGGSGGGAGAVGGNGGNGGSDAAANAGGIGGAGGAVAVGGAGNPGVLGNPGAVNSGGGGGGGGSHGSVGATFSGVDSTGGAGGKGGNGAGTGDGGGGGGGGYGQVITGSGNLGALSTTAIGGVGGAGGTGTVGGNGGSGGIGLLFTNGAAKSFSVNAPVHGGNGGAGGAAGGVAGPGGAGIVGSNLHIDLGAQPVTGGTGANAITFQGGTNILNFTAGGGGLTGNIGVTGSLELRGNMNNTIVPDIITDATGAGSVSTQGGFTITLTAANTYSGGTTINTGTLAISNDNNLGAASGGLTFGLGGTLRLNAAVSSARAVTLNPSGGIIDTDGQLTGVGNVVTLSGPIGGTGSLTKIGFGKLILSSNASTYSGGTRLDKDTLEIGANNALGTGTLTMGISTTLVSGAPNLNVGNHIGTVGFNTINTNGNTMTLSGTINGSFMKAGAGTLVLTNSTNGSVAINTGTLALSGTGSVNGFINANNGTFDISGVAGTGTSIAGLQGSGGVTLGTKTLTLNNASGVVFAGSISGSGGLTITTSGGLNVQGLSGVNTYTGPTTNLDTLLILSTGSITSNVTNQGVFQNAGIVTGAVTSNTTAAGNFNAGAGHIINTATGRWNGNVVSNAARITNNGVWTGNVLSNTGTITNNLTWTGTVSNAGTFNNNAGATVSGLLTNAAGTATNNGALNGGANVSGGTLTGSGTVTNVTVSGGTFAPGNGTPGTFMTVTGNLAFQSGAMYLVTLNPTTASFASVGGTASLNGTAAAFYLAGNYVAKKYTILTAASGVTGTFGSLVNVNAPGNVTSSLSYDANNAYLNLALSFVTPGGLNANQQNVANTLVNFFNTTGGIPAAFASLSPAGLTQASGELGTGVIQSSIKANDMFLNLLLDPSVAGRAGGFASGSRASSQFVADDDDDDETLAYAAKRKATSAERAAYAMATKAPYLAPQPVNRWSVWGAAYGGSARTDGNTVVGSNDTTARAYGIVGGADYKVSPDALIGFALAGGGTSFSIANALGSGSSDLFQAGVFGRQNIGAAYLSAALAYGWQDVTTNRTVTIAGTDLLQARFRAETFSARFEGGYRFATPLAGITPYVAAQAISFNLPAYAEQVLAGTGTFALNYGAQTTTATRTELGLRSDKSFAVQDGIFTLRGRAAWAHDYNSDRAVSAVFQTLPGASFVVNGARANPDGALVSAGAEMKWLSGFSLAATFEGEFSSNVTSYAGKGVARYTW